MKFKFENHLNTGSIIATLILGVASLVISYNSYRLSEKQTYLIERQNTLEEGQQRQELKSAVGELLTSSSMLRQREKDYPNIKRCLASFEEMKNILESQLKNKALFENRLLSDKWIELLSDVNFNIKFFEPGLSPNVTIDGAYNTLVKMENKSKELFSLCYQGLEKY